VNVQAMDNAHPKDAGHGSSERGIALVMALLVLSALSAMAAVFSMTMVTEKNIAFNHTVSQQALFASDAGLEVAKQQMSQFACDKLDSLTAVWPGHGAVITDPTKFFPAKGLKFTGADPDFTVESKFTFLDSALSVNSQAFDYAYESHSEGRSSQFGRRRTMIEGVMRLSATRGSFADFLIFTDVHSMPDGEPVWFHSSGRFDGRVHTNDALRFAFFPTFKDLVSSAGNTATYFNWGVPVDLDADRNGNVDVPDFFGGFKRGVARIDLPTNSFSQLRAAIGGNPSDTSPVANAEICAKLGITGGTGSELPPAGVYVASEGMKAVGGIYIQGEAKSIEMHVKGDAQQVYDIVDAKGRQWNVVVDMKKNTTKIKGPTSGQVLKGVPRGVIYANGRIDELTGPGRIGDEVQPALQKDTALQVVSTGDIVIQGDIKYQDYDNGENVLGLFSSGGDIRIGTSAPDELQIDAYVLASAYKRSFNVDDYDVGSYRGLVHLRGGMVTNYYGAFGLFGSTGMKGYGRDFRYDRRGKVPPYFPLTNRYVADRPIPQVLAWREVW
jgi:hypothetical protein